MQITDAHNHLHFTEFALDREAVLARAASAGVTSMLAVGIDPEDCLNALAVAHAHPGILVSLGIHPQNAGAFFPKDVHALARLRDKGPVAAVGETGFDLYRTPGSIEGQKDLFIAHVELARELGLPLVIHDRMGHEQTLGVLDDMNAWPLGGVFHCFSGDTALARRVTGRGFFISIPGVVTFRNAGELRNVVRETPTEFLLAETDAPYLSPAPYRGRRNEPAYVLKAIEEMANIKGMQREDMARITTENFARLFGRSGADRPAGEPKSREGGP